MISRCMFDIVTRTVLEHYTANPPATEDVWCGPWTTILTTLFPSTQGYIITPQRRLNDDSESHIPDFIIEVVKLATPPLRFRSVLIVEIKNSQHWTTGIPALQRQLNRQTDTAFAGTAYEKIYWIGTIGPHWRYGQKEDDGQDVQPLIDCSCRSSLVFRMGVMKKIALSMSSHPSVTSIRYREQ